MQFIWELLASKSKYYNFLGCSLLMYIISNTRKGNMRTNVNFLKLHILRRPLELHFQSEYFRVNLKVLLFFRK